VTVGGPVGRLDHGLGAVVDAHDDAIAAGAFAFGAEGAVAEDVQTPLRSAGQGEDGGVDFGFSGHDGFPLFVIVISFVVISFAVIDPVNFAMALVAYTFEVAETFLAQAPIGPVVNLKILR
jgi:hypothetical protein